MGSMVDHAKAETLQAMYRSVERMNHHIVKGNLGEAASEEHLQINLRSNFEELSCPARSNPK